MISTTAASQRRITQRRTFRFMSWKMAESCVKALNLPQKGYTIAEPSVPNQGVAVRQSVIRLVSRATIAGNNKSW
jgi:hypothetical protein